LHLVFFCFGVYVWFGVVIVLGVFPLFVKVSTKFEVSIF